MNDLQGHFLVAVREMEDPHFNRTVVLMIQHDADGALGLVLNRPLAVTLRQIWEQLGHEPCPIDPPIHQGGPCEGPLMALHTHADIADMTVMPGVHFSDDSDCLLRLASRGDSPLRFFAGYSGWSPGQLEDEIAAHVWFTTPATPQAIFAPHEKLWSLLQLSLNPAATLLGMSAAKLPDDPSMN